jgi:hypothetical protein
MFVIRERLYAQPVYRNIQTFVQPLLLWKTISITYSDCVFVALRIQHAMCMRHIFICGLSALQYFSPYLIKGTIFEKEKLTEHKMCFDFLYKLYPKHFSF